MTDQVSSGVLRWDPERQRLTLDDGGKVRPVNRPDRDLIGDLAGQDLAGLDGVAVDFDRRGGQARSIRRSGAAQPRRVRRADPEKFYNPYTFVPAPPRAKAPAGLADARTDGLAGHGRLRPELWTGRIAVTLTVRTPLLLLDPSRRTEAAESGHSTYPVLARDGVPHLAPTAVKGMLRSAYEAVTNSRFGVLGEHDQRLGYRMQAGDARSMVPGRVSANGAKLILLPGDTPLGGQIRPGQIQHAAWLPRYRGGWAKVDHPTGWEPGQGQAVQAWVELFQHYGRRGGRLVADFRLWRVRAVWPAGATPRKMPVATRPPEAGSDARHVPVSDQPLKQISGWAFISNQNIDRKHDERIFFADVQPQVTRDLTGPLRAQWERVVQSYRDAHLPREIHRMEHGVLQPPSKWLGKEPGKTAWSPHQYDDSYLSLQPGALCYAMLDDSLQVTGVYPVMVTRGLHELPPRSLVPGDLLPATWLDELSPADRVFGWVNGKGSGAYRGQLRIGPVRCDQGAAAVSSDVADFGPDGVPLAILGKPKPQQGRFYLSAHRSAPDQPLADGLAKSQWYAKNQGLRGRKFYWHHGGLADGYWDQPVQDRTQEPDAAGRFQEYRRPRKGSDNGDLTADNRAFLIAPDAPEQRDDQNRSVRGWVRPGSSFRTVIEIINLSTVELGGLAWLLTLPPEHFHRLGYGKPLGFGSVRLDVNPAGTDLRLGRDWIARYRSLSQAGDPPDPEAISAVLADSATAFETAATPDGAGASGPLAAFLAVTKGAESAAVHYPRARPDGMDDQKGPASPVPPDPRGRSFEWFSLNEKEQREKIAPGRGLSLPAPAAGPLPLHPADDRRRPAS